MKRAFDVLVAAAGLVATSPLWMIAAIAVKLSSPGPVLHKAVRVGMGGRPFTLYKFRSMRTEATGPAVTAGGDPRITALGRLLRRWKLDEIPQLFNVLVGDMSLVGPRPEDPKYVAGYTDEQRRVLDVRPGITGPAAIAYRDEESLLASSADPERLYVEEILPAKLELDLAYARETSFRKDLVVLLRTARAVLIR